MLRDYAQALPIDACAVRVSWMHFSADIGQRTRPYQPAEGLASR